mmetsp:Transcript_23005/g.47999  ORF Transcript_23005/g.47999 Transcript_23005/m.47999 type:complete len:431 (-) Transcript_23005:1280-2572(-)
MISESEPREADEPSSRSQHSSKSSQHSRKSHHGIDAAVHVLVKQGARPHTDASILGRPSRKVVVECYEDFPLLQSMIKYEELRSKFLDDEGKCQQRCPKSTSGWVRTLFIGKGRALDWIFFPWFFIVLHASIFAVVDHFYALGFTNNSLDDWRTLFTFALNATLGFLLVFRLNRAAARFWTARELWGTVVGVSRNLVSSLLVHGEHDPSNRDEAIRWIAAFALATKDFIRGEAEYSPDGYAGILSKSQVQLLERNNHPPLYAAFQTRRHLKKVFAIPEELSTATAIARAQQMHLLETSLDKVVVACGGLERIKGTPLPLVYVSHLRTFLLINLLLLPYVFGSDWGWYTIPLVAAASFAYLGLEAAAAEVEAPFRKDRPNALDMDGYCKGTLAGIQQLLLNFADASLDINPMELHGVKSGVHKDGSPDEFC